MICCRPVRDLDDERDHHPGISAPHSAYRQQPVRYDLSRAFFLFLALSDRGAGRQARAKGGRCRGTADPRRLASRVLRTRCGSIAASKAVSDLASREAAWGVHNLASYLSFSANVRKTKRSLLRFLIEAKSEGKRICGYGAPGKGNTLLNYCAIGTDFVDFSLTAIRTNMAVSRRGCTSRSPP